MQEKFNEYYRLTDAEIKKHWEEDVFSFDANVLLNLYRYTPETRDAFFNLLEKIKDRIWISYQAAFEYQKNRLIVINAQKEAYKEIRDTLEKKKSEIESKLNSFKKHPYLQTNKLKVQIESAFKAIDGDLSNLEKNHPDYMVEDPVWERLTKLLKGKIGEEFSKEDSERILREGKKRFDENVPPGYMDFNGQKNADEKSLYGDLLLWKQIIEKAKSVKCSIILITDDLKEDWWYKFQGRTISPRPELIKEFRNETQKRINIYQADRFVELANTNLKQKTTKEAIDEIRGVRMEDEKLSSKYGIEYFLFDTGKNGSKIKIRLNDIVLVIADDIDPRHKTIILKDGQKFTIMDCTMDEMLDLVAHLFQANPKHLVSINAVKEIYHDIIKLKDDIEPNLIILTSPYRRGFFGRFGSL